jgi:hypothetical protein
MQPSTRPLPSTAFQSYVHAVEKCGATATAIRALWTFLLAGLASCAAEQEHVGPTPYGPYGPHGGYTDQPLGDNRYIVSFRGNAYTPSETAVAYAYRRAGEVCRGSFDVVSQHDFSKVEVTADQSVAHVSSVKPRQQLVVQCKRKVVPVDEPPPTHVTPL